MSNAPHQSEGPGAKAGHACGAEGKLLAHLKARFALAGHAVHELSDGGFLVVHAGWNMTRHCPDLQALSAFAKQLGVR